MIIGKLVEQDVPGMLIGEVESDALREAGALQEAQLLDLRFDAVGSECSLLFDCRGALQIRAGNTAVITLWGARIMAWLAQPIRPWTAWTIVSWQPVVSPGGWRISIGFTPDAELVLEASGGTFLVGDVPGCDGPPPNYLTDDEAVIRAGLANWGSEFRIAYGTQLGRRGVEPLRSDQIDRAGLDGDAEMR